MSVRKNGLTRRKFLVLTGVSLAASALSACAAPQPASAPQSDAAEMPELIYIYTNFVGIPKDQALVAAALNEITKARIGAQMTLMNLEFGSFNDKIQLMSAGGEKYDFAFTSSWTNDYYKNVSNGVFVELDELLKQRAPNYYVSLKEDFWDAVRVKGKIYAGLNQQIFASPKGFVVKKPIVDKYKIDLTQINSWADLEPILEMVKTGEGITPMAGGSEILMIEIFGYTHAVDGIDFLVNKTDDQTAALINLFTTPEYKENWDLVKRWSDKGYLPKDITTFDDEVANMAASKGVFKTEPAIKPKGEAEFTQRYKSEVVLHSLSEPVIGGVTGTLTGVSRTTSSVEKAVDWLELINTDKPTYNLLCLGIEGKHWNWKDQSKEVVEQIKDSGYDPTTDWMFGNQFNAYYRSEAQIGAWEETKQMNDSAKISPTLGFVLDPEPVKNEIAACAAILDEYTPLGAKGSDSSVFPKIIAELEAAGSAKVVEEVQKQISAWQKGG